MSQVITLPVLIRKRSLSAANRVIGFLPPEMIADQELFGVHWEPSLLKMPHILGSRFCTGMRGVSISFLTPFYNERGAVSHGEPNEA